MPVPYLDETFKCSCKFFTQFFVVHDLINGYNILLVFVLIESETIASYDNIFQTIVEKFAKHGPHSSHEIVYAFRGQLSFPIASTRDCRFHPGQN